MDNTFQKRIEAIFAGFHVFLYREAPTGPAKDVAKLYGLDPRPWVEFDLRPLKRKHAEEACFVPVNALVKLQKLLGTDEVAVTGFNLGYEDEPDYVGYILAAGVKFPTKKRSKK